MRNEENPEFWLLMFLEALAGLRLGDKEKAIIYLRFVEKNRSRKIALKASSRLTEYAKTTIFKDEHKKIIELKKQLNV